MKHDAIRAHIQELIDKRSESLMEDDTQANYISVLAKIWSELSDISESNLEWMDLKDLDELILTVYYALSRQRHAITAGVQKEVSKYVRHEQKDWEFAHIMDFNE